MKVQQIYDEYMVPKNLQEHMLRVASLVEILLENWSGVEVDKKSIIQACLFHDIAKPLTFDLAKQAQYGMSEEDISRLEKLQNYIKGKFGNDEHQALAKICETIGLSQISVKLVNNLEWVYVPRLFKEKDIVSLIPIYCDMRIGPKSILSLSDRLLDLKNRVGGDDYNDNVKNGNLVEKELAKYLHIDVNSITEEQLSDRFEALLNTEI